VQDLVENAPICTLAIHGFAQQVIATHPLSLGADPEFFVLVSYRQIAAFYFASLSTACQPVVRTFNSKLICDDLVQLIAAANPALIEEAATVFAAELKVRPTQLARVNLSSTPELQQFIPMVPNPTVEQATLESVQSLEEEASSRGTRWRGRTSSCASSRSGSTDTNNSRSGRCSAYSTTNLLDILAPLVLSLLGFTKFIQLMALPLLLRQDKDSVRGCLCEIVLFLTVTIALHQQIQVFVAWLQELL
jgi:hypothetical protein